MAAVNPSYAKTEDDNLEMNNMEAATGRKVQLRPKCYSYEEALDLTGHGRYNVGLLLACFMVITAMGIDIFGLGIIVAAAQCDLAMSLEDVGVLSSMPFAGIIVMSYPWGYLSDTRGRKLVLMWAMGGSFVAAFLSSLAPNWQTLAVLRFISSALSSAAESATYALLGECCTAAVRARYMLLVTSALMLTPTIYYVLGYLIMKLDFSVTFLFVMYRPWRLLTMVMALPLGIGALMLYFYGESPKFLANVGRNEDAVAALKRIYVKNGGMDEFPEVKKYNLLLRVSEVTKKVEVAALAAKETTRDRYIMLQAFMAMVREIFLDEENKEEVGTFSLKSLWTQIAPLFKTPLLGRTLLLYFLTFVVYIANNSFAIILPTIFNVFFTALASSASNAGFCDLFALSNTTKVVEEAIEAIPVCKNTINDFTILAGCVHGISFFILNALISQCAMRRKVLTIAILIIAAAAAIAVNNINEPVSGLVMFYVYLTTAMIFGVVSSYFVDLFPTSYRGMVACLGMMVARLSAFAGTNVVSRSMTNHCSITLYGAAVLVICGAVASAFLPSDKKNVS